MRRGLIGQIATPAAGNAVELTEWVADNGVFADTYPGDAGYLDWLENRLEHRQRCRFVVAPDVVRGPDGELRPDAQATLDRSAPMLPQIRSVGFPAALVAQNGLEELPVPWTSFDALFIGGDDRWKLGAAARGLIREAKRRGKWVHMGRVNSLKRLRYAHMVGCDSVDGTYLAFGPDRNLPRLLSWLTEVNGQSLLWEAS